MAPCYRIYRGIAFLALPWFWSGVLGATPTITGINPNSATTGSASFTLTVDGADFMPQEAVNPIAAGSDIYWNDTRLPTTFVSSSRLTAPVPAALLTSPGTAVITVMNPIFVKSNPVAFTIQGPPEVVVAGVVNAAGFFAGAVAPGTIVSLFGNGIGPTTGTPLRVTGGVLDTTLGGARVYFDGIPAPLTFAQAAQVNAIVPYGVALQGSTNVVVEMGGQRSRPFTISLAESSPALFTADGSGKGQGAILNQDYSINGARNPASRGSVVMLFATGAGRTDPDGVDGKLAMDALPKPRLPVSATIGGLPAKVLYQGAAPTLVAGVLQVNVLVPEEVPPGEQVSISIRVGNAVSPSNVTLAIR